jgi:hypothetical protein
MTDFTLGLDEAAKILNAENNIVPRTDQNMNPTAAIIVMLMLSLTISSMGFFPFASAFVNIVSPWFQQGLLSQYQEHQMILLKPIATSKSL